MPENLFCIYIVLINLAALIIMGVDKHIARTNGRTNVQRMRIPESVLFLVAFLLGGIGCCIGMKLFHHKTRKLKFCIGMPFAVVCNAVTVYFLMSLI